MILFISRIHMFRKFYVFFGHYLLPSQHISGSAYKIVNKRAYHHGTMLISTRLDHLSDLLRPEQVLFHLFSSAHRSDFLSYFANPLLGAQTTVFING